METPEDRAAGCREGGGRAHASRAEQLDFFFQFLLHAIKALKQKPRTSQAPPITSALSNNLRHPRPLLVVLEAQLCAGGRARRFRRPSRAAPEQRPHRLGLRLGRLLARVDLLRNVNVQLDGVRLRAPPDSLGSAFPSGPTTSSPSSAAPVGTISWPSPS